MTSVAGHQFQYPILYNSTFLKKKEYLLIPSVLSKYMDVLSYPVIYVSWYGGASNHWSKFLLEIEWHSILYSRKLMEVVLETLQGLKE